MKYLASIDLSLYTLLGFFAVPFFYFSYHKKYRRRPQIVRRVDFLLATVACALAAFVLLKVGLYGRNADLEFRLLALLHLGPLVLALLCISEGRKKASDMGRGVPAAGTDKRGGYEPEAIDQESQRLAWDDLIIPKSIKEEFQSIVKLLQDPATARKYGIEVPKGILLHGRAGSGKAMLSQVVASQAQLTLYKVPIEEVLSSWQADAASNFFKLFETVTQHTPALVFLDGVDLIGARSAHTPQQGEEGMLNHLLHFIDGLIGAEGVFIFAAADDAALVDTVLKRPGRLHKVIEIPKPDFDARKELFKRNLLKLPLCDNVDLDFFAGSTVGASADLIEEICNQAAVNAYHRELAHGDDQLEYKVSNEDIEAAIVEFAEANSPDEMRNKVG